MYTVISDIHGNLPALRAVLDDMGHIPGNTILCAGDLVGYGADPGRVIGCLSDLGVRSVLGNHDAVVSGVRSASGFNPAARKAAEWTRRKLRNDHIRFLEQLPYVIREDSISVVHGTLHEPGEFIYMMTPVDAMRTFEVMSGRICFVGHSHVPGVYVLREGKLREYHPKKLKLHKGARYVINAGSVGQPRDGDSRACYCRYDEKEDSIEFRRVEYDVSRARKSIIKAGLPDSLGDRLLMGR
ncbi:MAG: metallophosphoesterase [Candidatus Omnitrophica bacterium]|nr:metallophosphoesterase [Candidatus Omnitrophota bacterium]